MDQKIDISKRFSTTELLAISGVLEAAGHATLGTGGLVMAGDSEGWVELARFGFDASYSTDLSLESKIRIATTRADIVIVNSKDRTQPFDGLGSLVCVAIRGSNLELYGAFVIYNVAETFELSAAQHYSLQTYAAEFSLLLSCGLEVAKVAPLPFERLRLLESVVINAKDSILITEAEPVNQPGPRIVYANPAFEKTTGFRASEIIGATPRILQSEKTSRETLDKIRRALEKWEAVEVELINARKDGSAFWVDLSIVPVADEHGWFTHWISVQRDITERKEAEQLALNARDAWEEKVVLKSQLQERERISAELSYAAYHDELTALYNRAYLMCELEKMFQSRQLMERSAAVLFIDLDGFKLVNDSLGHQSGDELLNKVAQLLKGCVRADDVLARIGGDEFAILVAGADHVVAATELSKRIIGQLNKPISLHAQDIFVSCSIGVVCVEPRHLQPDDVLRDADLAMYTAKNQGRGRWMWFDSSMHDAVVNQLLLQNALRLSVVSEDFILFYQPIYSGVDRQLTGLEALVRWVHPQLGMIRPDVFISIAEDLGLIQQLGAWVMRKACEEVLQWQTDFPTLDLMLNVNVSGKELVRDGYLEQLAAVLKDTQFDPSHLQVEITESVFLFQPELVAEVLTGIRSMGVRVGLDDFGTGYSSLSYIDRYPIDAIKIDKSFVSRMMHLPRSRAIVESILALGIALDLDVVAEGVETAEQMVMLEGMRCPFMQGYYLSHPIDRLAIIRLLNDTQAL